MNFELNSETSHAKLEDHKKSSNKDLIHETMSKRSKKSLDDDDVVDRKNNIRFRE